MLRVFNHLPLKLPCVRIQRRVLWLIKGTTVIVKALRSVQIRRCRGTVSVYSFQVYILHRVKWLNITHLVSFYAVGHFIWRDMTKYNAVSLCGIRCSNLVMLLLLHFKNVKHLFLCTPILGILFSTKKCLQWHKDD